MKAYKNKLVVILFVIAFYFGGVFLTGCVKDVGPSGVENAAITIEVVMETFVDEGLRLLSEHDPEQVPEIVTDLRVVVAQIALYKDGLLTVGDFISTLTAVLDRVNERADLIDNENAARVLRTIGRAGKIVGQYFQEVALPEEVQVYADALSSGIVAGMEAYAISLPLPLVDGGTE